MKPLGTGACVKSTVTKMMNYAELKIANAEKARAFVPDISNGTVDFYPVFLQIEQTNRCNAECIMCNHFYLGNRGYGDLDIAVIEKLRPILPYCSTIMLNGDGEPFLCPSIEQNIQCFSEYGVKIGTNTNLCYVPDGLWHFFCGTFEFLNISCDGATRETFEMIRHGLKWSSFLKNLDKLNAVAPLLKKNMDCVVSKQNIRELSDIVKLGAEYGIDSVRFRRLGVNPCIGNSSDQVEYYYSNLSDSLARAQGVGKELGIEVTFPAYQAYSQQFPLPQREEMATEISKRKRHATDSMRAASLEDDYYSEIVTESDWTAGTWYAEKACRWAVERCYIDIRGNVTTCCYNMKKHMGSLKNQTFSEIWNGVAYTEFRKLMAKALLPEFCRNCNWIKEASF